MMVLLECIEDGDGGRDESFSSSSWGIIRCSHSVCRPSSSKTAGPDGNLMVPMIGNGLDFDSNTQYE